MTYTYPFTPSRGLFIALVAACASMGIDHDTAHARGGLDPDASFNIVRPSTTGVPGEELRVMTFDSQGNLWVAARWPFWGEVGIARLPAEEVPAMPIPGGGFDTGPWQVWSNYHHPIPSPYVDDLVVTPEGIVWIASDGGLTRFNPDALSPEQMWFTYNAGNSPLIMDEVRSLDIDLDGNLWLTNVSVQSADGALFKFNPERDEWQKFTVGDDLPWPSSVWKNVNAVHVGVSGKIYVTHSVLGGFAEYDGQTWTLHEGGGSLGEALEDLDGNVWFASSSSGLWKWNGNGFQSWSPLGGTGTVTGLALHPVTGEVYVSTWYGPTYRMENGTTPVFFVDADALPYHIEIRPDGDVWIGNYGGNGVLGTARHYTAEGELLERLNTFNSGLGWYFVDNIQTDSAGNMWFASGEGGLTRMLGSNGAPGPGGATRWRNWGNHNDQSEPYPWAGNEPMYSMHEDDQGFIWMGGNGVGKWDPLSGEFVGFWNWQNSSLGVDSFVAIAQDGNGDIWIASDYTGVYRYNPATDDWEQKLFGAPSSTANYVQDMVVDLDGNLWVATYVSLHLFNGTQWFGVGTIHGSPVFLPTCLEIHPIDGSLWVGAQNGLIRYQNGEWTIYDADNSPMPTSQVKGLDIRSDGLIGFTVADFSMPTPWPNAVVLFDGSDGWQTYSYGTHPLPHYQLGDVEFDAEGDLWVSTISEGVVEIDLAPLGGDPPTPGDLNGDGVVDGADLGLLLGAFGTSNVAADLNADGFVDGADLGILLGNFG